MNATLLPIQAIARKLEIDEDYLEPQGLFGAKIRLELLADSRYPRRGRLILVTATTPTTSGEGKTVTAIGLAQGLERIGKRGVVVSREPSLGPVFGLKGGAAGGGRSRVEPADKINLHFHGDFHAITSAHNLLSALIDNHLHFGNALGIDPERITWPRAMDMNDRALREIAVGQGKGNGPEHDGRFVITAASEIMAIMGLAGSRSDLRERLGRIVAGFTRSGCPVTCANLEATGSMMVLLNDALLPNLVQTTDGTPALVHIGPFANIAHGTSSVLAQEMGLRLADYVVNETGFASDLGAEKYFDLVMRSSGIEPAAAVLVVTVQSVKAQGRGALERGLVNLDHHAGILRRFGVPVLAAINRFPLDTREELASIGAHCVSLGIPCAVSEAYAKGGAGSVELAEKVVELLENGPRSVPRSLYSLELSFAEKIRTVAREVYGAEDIEISDRAGEKLRTFEEHGYGQLPVCIAKTQYSLSDDPKLFGAPSGWTLRISDAFLSAGAGFVVVVAGTMLLMPGLPKLPRAMGLDVSDSGNVIGLE
jgi:formate--tetrahydrofolate ligase